MSNSNCTTPEVFLPVAIPEYSQFYEVSNHGRVRSVKFDKTNLMHPSPNHQGYLRVTLSGPKSLPKTQSVHRLVALTFLGQPPTDKHVVAHNDGSTNNNCVSNLRWATIIENRADMVIHETDKKGERHSLAKLSEIDVANIYKLREKGLFQREIAEHYGVTTSCINRILRGRCWSHLKNPIISADIRGEKCHNATLKNADILRMHELRNLGYSHQHIADVLGINRRNVSRILQGMRWSHVIPTVNANGDEPQLLL